MRPRWTSTLLLLLLVLAQRPGYCDTDPASEEPGEDEEHDSEWEHQEANFRDDESMKGDFGERRVYTLHHRYYHGGRKQIKAYLECVKGFEGFELKPDWKGLEPPGAKLLFIGNSHMGQYKEALVLGMDDSLIKEETYNVYYSGDYERLGRCPCVLHKEGGRLHSTYCDPVDVRALGVQGSIVCNGRRVKENLDPGRDLSFVCDDMLSKVVMQDGSTIVNIKNNPYLIFPTGIQDAVSNVGLALGEFDVIVANEANHVGSTVTNRCGASMASIPEWGKLVDEAVSTYDHGERDRAIRPASLISTLMEAGFSGTLLYTSNEKWTDIPEEVHALWNGAVEKLRPGFHVLPFEVMSPTAHPLHERCGEGAHVHGHHTMPGPPTLGGELVRLEVEKIVCKSRPHECRQL